MLYIKIIDGQPVDHPITGENLLLAYPEIKKTGLPADFVLFKRVDPPKNKAYKVLEVSYGIVDGVAQDIWTYRDMTDEERNAQVGTYINTITGKYPLHEGDIRLEHPEIGEDQTGATFPCPPIYAKVLETDPPETNGTLSEYVVELPPAQINGVWTRQWELKTRTPAQVEALQKFLDNLNSQNQGTE